MSQSTPCRRCEAVVPEGASFCAVCGEEVGTDAAHDPHARLRERLSQAVAGHYHVLDVLGVGGMGVVFLADDPEQNRKVAIKVLSPELAADANIVERFAREARTAAALEHPGIVRIYADGRERGLHYFVMQHVEGRSLSDLLREEPRMSIHDTTRILRDAAAALAHAHSHGVVHRDVKPENIMLDAKGRVLLADFGISKMSRAASDAKTIVKLTETGGIIGTPHYIAPEHALGQAVDGRADQYALAVVGFQMLAGQVPFDDETAAAIIHLHINSAAPRLSALRPDVPPELAAVLARAMSKAPAHRFATMEEFAAAVGGPPVRRPVPARAVALVLSLLIVGGLAGGAWLMRHRSSSAAPTQTVVTQAAKSRATKTPAAKPVAKSPATKPAAAKTSPTKPAATPARQTAALSITSSPNATLFIDGKRIGVTPLAGHALSKGKHQIRLERKGYRIKRDTINVTGTRTLTRSYALQREGR